MFSFVLFLLMPAPNLMLPICCKTNATGEKNRNQSAINHIGCAMSSAEALKGCCW